MKAHEYDEPGYIPGEAISVNWLLNQLLNGKDLQITKIDREQLNKFLITLVEGKLVMPNGQPGIIWLRDQIKEKYEMSKGQRTEAWDETRQKYQFILHCIDLTKMRVPEEELKEQEKYEFKFEVTLGNDEQAN